MIGLTTKIKLNTGAEETQQVNPGGHNTLTNQVKIKTAWVREKKYLN